MGDECIGPRFLTSVLVGGEWSASRPGRFTHWKGSWVICKSVCLDWWISCNYKQVMMSCFTGAGMDYVCLVYWGCIVPWLLFCELVFFWTTRYMVWRLKSWILINCLSMPCCTEWLPVYSMVHSVTCLGGGKWLKRVLRVLLYGKGDKGVRGGG
jgi:hypothetical protein